MLSVVCYLLFVICWRKVNRIVQIEQLAVCRLPGNGEWGVGSGE